MLHKMASSDVGKRENPSVLLWALWSVLFFKGSFAGFVVNQILPMHEMQTLQAHISVFFLCIFSENHLRVFSSSYFCSIYFGRVWFPYQTGRVPPPVKHEECKWLMRVRVVFLAKREQMLSEMLWWFPPQIRLPILPAPLLLLTQPSNPCTAWDWLSSNRCLCLWSHNYNNIVMLKAKAKRPLFHITKSHTVQREGQLFLRV